MGSFSTAFVVSTFVAGVICGATFVTVVRCARIEMLKKEFQQELEAMCRRQMTAIRAHAEFRKDSPVPGQRVGRPYGVCPPDQPSPSGRG